MWPFILLVKLLLTDSRLLAVFGQDLTNNFLSQSIHWYDGIIFAVGPLGVIWVLSAAVRVLGSPFLLGRGSESEEIIEKDLKSCTSQEVCELWDGNRVARMVGQGQIQEYLVIGADIWKEYDAKDKKHGFFKSCGKLLGANCHETDMY